MAFQRLLERVGDQRVIHADNAHIKSQLRLTTTELAKYLGVSRQAIYDWRSGGHVKSNNMSKLENLSAAASVLENAGAEFTALQINRQLPGGRSLLETIASGGNGYESAQSLVNMLRREAQQRQRRAAQFANRRPVIESALRLGDP